MNDKKAMATVKEVSPKEDSKLETTCGICGYEFVVGDNVVLMKEGLSHVRCTFECMC